MKRTHLNVLCSLIGGALLFGLPHTALAEETATQEFTLDEYIVTANRVPVKKAEIAANVTVITHEEIEQGDSNSLPDILKKANVTLQSNGYSSVPVLNGDDRVLILVDGRRMGWDHLTISGNSHASVNLDLLPVKNIERIEIVKGPASSLYGSDAIGGVINIITRKADTTNTSVSTEFGSWGYQRYNLLTEGRENGIGYVITAEKKKRDNFEYKDSKTGTVKTFGDSYIDQETQTLHVDKDFSKGSSLSLDMEHIDAHTGFGAYLTASGTPGYPNGYIDSTDNNTALTYRWGQNTGMENWFKLYHNSSDIYSSAFSYRDELYANGLEYQQSWKPDSSQTLVGGAEWRETHLDELYTTGDSIDKGYSTSALFMEDRFKLPENWTLTFGTRYDNHSVAGGHVTSRASLNRQIDDKTNVYASWGQYVRNPRIAELYSNTQYWKGNTDLRPETGNTVTIGVNTELAKGTTLQGSIYSSDINDAFKWETVTGQSYGHYVNVDKEKRQGLDLSLSQKLSSQWALSAGYTYSKIESKSDTDTDYSLDLTNSQPNGYRLNTQYNEDKWDADLTLRAGTGRSLTKFTSSSYLTMDVTINYKMDHTTKLYLKGYNLTNQAYELTAPYLGSQGAYAMPARSFLVGVEHRM